ncbi:MAG TPA: hypothetical protein VKZ39_01765, partial [Sphaerochaetaceae bacterium]|nr:hypothetical protein [Sphaerochaetaceae bacterium]
RRTHYEPKTYGCMVANPVSVRPAIPSELVATFVLGASAPRSAMAKSPEAAIVHTSVVAVSVMPAPL